MISVFLRRMIWLSSLTLLLWVGMNALPPPICAAAPTVQHSTYPLEKMPLLRLVLRLLQRFYIDPTQFKAAKMHKAGLQALERRLPEARVTWQTRQKKYTLQLGPHRKSFPSRRFIGLFDVWLRLQPVARFVKQHYKGEAPLSEIEYAMVIGVMSTLDKQTRVMSRRILLRRRALRPRRKSGKIGVVLRWDKKNKYLQIQRIQPDGPADLAGLADLLGEAHAPAHVAGDRALGDVVEQVLDELLDVRLPTVVPDPVPDPLVVTGTRGRGRSRPTGPEPSIPHREQPAVVAELTVDTQRNKVHFITWVIREELEPSLQSDGGDLEPVPPIVDWFAGTNATEYRFSVKEPGEYRLFCEVSDNFDGSAVANIPFLVTASSNGTSTIKPTD